MIIPKIPRWSTIPQNPLHFGLGFDYYTKKKERKEKTTNMAEERERWWGCLKRRILKHGQNASQGVSYMTPWDENGLGLSD